MTRDLDAVSETVDDLVMDLREERLKQMKKMLKESCGGTLQSRNSYVFCLSYCITFFGTLRFKGDLL